MKSCDRPTNLGNDDTIVFNDRQMDQIEGNTSYKKILKNLDFAVKLEYNDSLLFCGLFPFKGEQKLLFWHD